ncbi:MAG TPA: hypothetical protein VG897_04470 [Terriglobales bacterium]|nr:hypothetical protein [Terriglobales bacterium]
MTRGTYFDHAERLIEREGKRYPRSFHPPLSMELQVLKRDDGGVVLAMPSITLNGENKASLINAINVVVELFGTCRVLNESLRPITPIHRAHWKVLAAQARSWPNVATLSEKVVEELSAQRREILRTHFETISTLHPPLCAVGQQGFLGLLVFGFPSHRLHLLERFHQGETVGIVGDWPAVSELPIGSLLQDSSAAFKIPHSDSWRHELFARLTERNVGA